jgi:uncharacterized protein
MQIIALPDLHEDLADLAQIADVLRGADLVLLPGDTCNGKSRMVSVLEQILSYNAQALAIPGNWENEAVVQEFEQRGINLHLKVVERDGIAFMGVGYSLPLYHAGEKHSEGDFAAYLANTADLLPDGKPFVLVVHEPPAGTLNMRTFGSHSIRTFIEQRQPMFCFCGHVHEAVGIDRVGQTQIVNPGPLYQGRYAWAKITPQDAEVEIRRWK